MTRKRLFDVAIASATLLIISPVLLLITLAVLTQMGRPVLFRQWRAGRGGQPFEILKFRTMRPSTSHHWEPSADQERLTELGRFLRRWSFDELPQLINVVRGDMSLVGPRPLP